MASIIVALDGENIIGSKGGIPWKIKEDLLLFKARTIDHICIMGRKTWDGLPLKSRPLPYRINIVISNYYFTHTQEFYHGLSKEQQSSCLVSNGIHDAIHLAEESFPPDKKIFIIGGSEIYKQALIAGVVDEMYISKIDGVHEGDTYFPEIGPEWEWSEIADYSNFALRKYTKIKNDEN